MEDDRSASCNPSSRSFRADLHCHSLCSDGSDEPLALLRKAKEVYLAGLSITDHDTMAAYVPEVFAEAERLHIALLPGVEISSSWEGASVHVLGYGCERFLLDPFLHALQEKRAQRNLDILQKLREKGRPIFEKDIPALHLSSVGRPHIAEAMVRKGYVVSKQDAFDRYLKEGASCYVLGFRNSPAEVIEEIHRAKGKAVLAHPHRMAKNLVQFLLGLPFDGIECYYGGLTQAAIDPWLRIAREKGWIATGGSDYHGSYTGDIALGSSWVEIETFIRLYHVLSKT